MKEKIFFKINEKDFFAVGDLAKLISFEVKSVPKKYKVIWNEDKNIEKLIGKYLFSNKNNLLLIDENILNLYCKNLQISQNRIFKAKATEEFKTLEGIVNVIDFLDKNNFTKGENLIVVGGGIIQDVGAFAGACYKRGITWIYIPTTLLSMCDSCIGGKTGINHNNAKNQLALFSAPSQVIINPLFLKTLEEKDLRSGLGEVLKLHITGGREFITLYKKLVKKGKVNKFSDYKRLILASLSVKKAIIEKDEFELNHRRSLNYGHTIGHAVEILSKYDISHGKGIVIGMLILNEFSYKKNLLNLSEKRYLETPLFDLLDKETIKKIKAMPIDGIGALLKKDKKTLGATVNFVILKALGDMILFPVEIDSSLLMEIKEIIKDLF